ncbi:MAG: hypothetical protein K2Q03_04930 [Sphingobacteriaceae bacterium]|nr:hypothetical protein [Sphingobacteriaceae bacterium]
MSNLSENQTPSMQNANNESIYKLIGVGVVVCVIGSFLRFAFDSMYLSIASWAILFVGAFICSKAVFKILKS